MWHWLLHPASCYSSPRAGSGGNLKRAGKISLALLLQQVASFIESKCKTSFIESKCKTRKGASPGSAREEYLGIIYQ